MKLWSKGLGTKTLVLRLGEGVPRCFPDGLIIKGTIKEPVWWDYTITMTDKDIMDLFSVAVNKETVVYLQSVERPVESSWHPDRGDGQVPRPLAGRAGTMVSSEEIRAKETDGGIGLMTE